MEDRIRSKLLYVIKEYGVSARFLANKLNRDYYSLIKFKNGNSVYSLSSMELLEKYLDENYTIRREK